jgi:hypothetical protein
MSTTNNNPVWWYVTKLGETFVARLTERGAVTASGLVIEFTFDLDGPASEMDCEIANIQESVS